MIKTLEQVLEFMTGLMMTLILVLAGILGMVGISVLWEGIDEENHKKAGFGLITVFLTISSLIITIYIILYGW